MGLLAIRNAIEDAGVNPAEVDGIVFDASTTTGAWWPEGEPVPGDFLAAFQNTSDPFDGLIQLSAEWLVKNMPELTGLKFVMTAPGCMSRAAAAAAEAVGLGMGQVVLSVKGWHDVPAGTASAARTRRTRCPGQASTAARSRVRRGTAPRWSSSGTCTSTARPTT